MPRSPAFNLTIDATPPPAPAALTLLSTDDSGTKGDGITNVRQPHLIGSSIAGALIQIINASNTVLGSANAATDGSYSVLVSSPLSDGTYALRVQVQDAERKPQFAQRGVEPDDFRHAAPSTRRTYTTRSR